MAMFLSRLKQILNLGTKSITANGTYSASGDGYDGYSQVTVNVPTVTPPSITPSNSSPAQMTANSPVNPTANGYAIASYEEIDVPSAVYTHNIWPDMPTISRVGALVGVEQLHFHSLDPSNSNPTTISDGEIYRAGNAGKAVASVTDVTPSSTPTSVSMDDVVHIQGSGVIVDNIPTPTSITPSNSNPAALTSGSAVTPSANGYAIESYSTVMPSGTPISISSGDIVKISGGFNNVILDKDDMTDVRGSNTNPEQLYAGSLTKIGGTVPHTVECYAIKSYTPVTPSSTPTSISQGDMVQVNGSGVIVDSISTPTSITPSNTSPVTLVTNNPVNPTSSGYAIQSYGTVTPSNANPPEMHTGAIYKISTRDGYLISTTNIVEPSDSNPPLLSNDNSWYRLNGANGYLYHTQQPKVKVGTCTNSSSSPANVSVTLGFKPKYLCVSYADSVVLVYDERHSTTKHYRCTSTPGFSAQYSFGQSAGNALYSIDDNGFTLRSSANRTWNYFAIG